MSDEEFGSFSQLIIQSGREHPDAPALRDNDAQLSWGELNDKVERIAARLQQSGLERGQAVAILGTSNIAYALVFIASIRAGGCAAPLTTSATPAQLAAMLADSGARHLFVDAAKLADLKGTDLPPVETIPLEDLGEWMAPSGETAQAAPPQPDDPFNIIYSSGTTGTPKGIVHSHAMRWRQLVGGFRSVYDRNSRTLVSTPLYSNTTLATFLPTVAQGGYARIMPKFDAGEYLAIAQEDRITHTMLVPVQYQRLMAREDFGSHDLSSFLVKFCTSAPFPAELKADVLARWPGGLVEVYGMTEGGVVCLLSAHEFPGKLHTVGRPIPGHELIVIDEDGKRLPAGSKGELVGRSPTMMSGYKNQPEKTRAMEWRDENGDIWFRTGDIGVVDADGFVAIVGRAKDMIISGGFNIYPKDLEELIEEEAEVAEAAVVGIASAKWGETPVGFVVWNEGAAGDTAQLLERVNARLGKTQRLSALHAIDEMPRSHIGKLLKTDLRNLAEASGVPA